MSVNIFPNGNYVPFLPDTPTNGTGGSGIATASPSSIDYSGPPTDVPPTVAAICVDPDGRQWQYFQGAWH